MPEISHHYFLLANESVGLWRATWLGIGIFLVSGGSTGDLVAGCLHVGGRATADHAPAAVVLVDYVEETRLVGGLLTWRVEVGLTGGDRGARGRRFGLGARACSRYLERSFSVIFSFKDTMLCWVVAQHRK